MVGAALQVMLWVPWGEEPSVIIPQDVRSKWGVQGVSKGCPLPPQRCWPGRTAHGHRRGDAQRCVGILVVNGTNVWG